MRRLLLPVLLLGGFFSLLGCLPTREDMIALGKESAVAASTAAIDRLVTALPHAGTATAQVDVGAVARDVATGAAEAIGRVLAKKSEDQPNAPWGALAGIAGTIIVAGAGMLMNHKTAAAGASANVDTHSTLAALAHKAIDFADAALSKAAATPGT